MRTLWQKILSLWNNKPAPFIILILIVSFFYLRFDHYISLRPMSDHTWAQCDRASVARNYADQSMNFFLPRVHYTCGGDGIVGLEFPAINYFVAILYKCFGFNEAFYRLTMLLIIFAGLFALMKIANSILNHLWISMMLVLSWYLSPVLTYYTPNFLPDAGSLGFVLLLWYYFFQAIKNPSRKLLLMLFVTGALASLIKITSSISIITVMAVSIINILMKEDHRLFKKEQSKQFIFISSAILMITGLWYFYASYLNEIKKSGVFLMNTNPPESYHELIFNIKFIWHRFSNLYYHTSFYIMLSTSTVLLLFYIRRTDKLLLLITISLYLGSAIFMIMMARQFLHHEYYILTVMPALFFQLLCTTEVVKKTFNKKYITYGISICLMTVVCFTGDRARKFLKGRFSEFGSITSGTDDFLKYHDLEPYLRSLGITPEQEVLSYFDNSPNITLYLMNQKGWTIPFGKDSSSLAAVTIIEADYVIFNNKHAKETQLPAFILNQKIGQHKSISIYKKMDPAK